MKIIVPLVFMVAALVGAWFVPQNTVWGKILFYVLMGVVVLAVGDIFRVASGKGPR